MSAYLSFVETVFNPQRHFYCGIGASSRFRKHCTSNRPSIKADSAKSRASLLAQGSSPVFGDSRPLSTVPAEAVARCLPINPVGCALIRQFELKIYFSGFETQSAQLFSPYDFDCL